ncbi:ABC transporter substrate-binding protein [Hahella sp. KA22]|uniref:ABC transporter substrate binding protein n=1 Tax=Hahella sp. KA22 TaxID=1628392 RepID=UPI000FDF63E3|nr:ABC transporter substrate binding protein [Hahella sp. KA22]AZZ92257.1 ABC transporter substrate-binding protein [Hahella sp. KA22]QAY55628.1 ABC transporter substrate-binding protein [Hahella sp. KA22]
MRNSITRIVFLLTGVLGLTLLLVMTPPAAASHPPDTPQAQSPPAHAPWRLAYYEGGPHGNYHDYLEATIRGLIALGWIEPVELPSSEADARTLWSWLAQNVKSQYLTFLDDAYYSADWEQDSREKIRADIIDRMNRRKDIDLVFAMGTWAGQDLANNRHHTPIFVISASDPIQSGIIKSAEDSGYDHVFARVSPQRYEKQLRVFHEAVGFKRLGVAYEDSVDGRAYASLENIEKVARENRFKVVSCYTLSDIPDNSKAVESVLSCIDKLAPEVDALYITMQGGVNERSIPKIVKIANKHKLPTFSQLGSEEVKYGVLMSMSRPDFESVGNYLASCLGQVINGVSPRALKQLFEEKTNISLNLKTAEVIGIYLRADWLAAADEIYREIQVPD